MSTNNVALIGLAVMGANLAKNLANNNFKVAVYNRSYDKTEALVSEYQGPGEINGYQQLTELISSLERPRKIILLVKSGQPVDDFKQQILPLLQAEDILIDLGNSNWKDTERRQKELAENGKGVHWVGSGISGGEEGALKGASVMPGGNATAVQQILPILEAVSAKDFTGNKCVTNIGSGASGHFVKMVHNGIEYAIMQAIAEVYDLLKSLNYSNAEILEVFESLNSGQLQSFLLEITVGILKTKTPENQYLLDLIKDEAKAKGTGGWTVEAALEFGVYAPAIAEAVMARTASARQQNFGVKKMEMQKVETEVDKEAVKNLCYQILEIVYLTSYFQGLDIIASAEKEKTWNINLAEVVRIWQGGCIIRSQMLKDLHGYWTTPEFEFRNVAEIKAFTEQIFRPLPVISSCINYVLTLQSSQLPTNLIQAQRDYFGAHTYKRTDQEGDFSGGWSS